MAKILRFPGSRLLPLLAFLLLSFSLGACSFHASGSAKTSASAKSKSKDEGKGKSGAHFSAASKTSANTKSSASANASGKGSAKGSASGKSSASSGGKGKSSFSLVFKTNKRASGVSSSSSSSSKKKKKDNFKATFLVRGGKKGSVKVKGGGSASAKGSATGSATGKASGSAGAGGSSKGSGASKDADKKDKETKTAKKDEPKETKKKSKKDKKKKTAKKPKETKKKDKPKAPEEPVEVVVIDPPEAPPENEFGYEDPVRGCFEGIIYPLENDAKKLPTTWDDSQALSVVYACEWDIPTRKWERGFPGVEDRFEWFAIRYTGSFFVETPGKWKFRISSDDGTKLYIDGKLVLDNDGQHPPKSQEITIDLEKGDHDMVLEYFQGPRYHINLQVYATPPGGEEGIFSVR